MIRAFQRTTLRTKSLVLIGTLAACLGAIALLAVLAMRPLERNVSQMTGEWLPDLQQIAMVERTLQQAHFEFTRATAWANTGLSGDALDRQMAKVAASREAVQALLNRHNAGETVPVIGQVSEAVATYISANDNAAGMLAVDPMFATMLANEADSHFDTMIVEARAIANDLKAEIETASAAALVQTAEGRIRFFVLCAVFAVLGLALVRSIVRSISKPILRMTGVMKALANYDLDVEIEGADLNNEIGDMAKALAVFRDATCERERLRESEEKRAREVAETEAARKAQAEAEAQRLQKAIAEISQNASSVMSGSRELSGAASSLAGRTETTAANVQTTAGLLRDLSTATQTAAQSAEQVNTLASEALERTRAGEDVVQRAMQTMREIAQFSEKVEDFVGVIENISFQTNLLALNASVEAARAGEAGKGFSVVAAEVRALANRAAEAAREIDGLMRQSSERVENGVFLVNRTGEELGAIAGSVSAVAQNLAEIASNARSQARAIGEVNTAVEEIDTATQGNAAMFEQTTAATEMLAETATALFSLAERFNAQGTSKAAGHVDSVAAHAEPRAASRAA
jgi:methyl-accepting chemotaxis protein